jgi:6-phosphogluconolactonase (cycloisomerase 2 family)
MAVLAFLCVLSLALPLNARGIHLADEPLVRESSPREAEKPETTNSGDAREDPAASDRMVPLTPEVLSDPQTPATPTSTATTVLPVPAPSGGPAVPVGTAAFGRSAVSELSAAPELALGGAPFAPFLEPLPLPLPLLPPSLPLALAIIQLPPPVSVPVPAAISGGGIVSLTANVPPLTGLVGISCATVIGTTCMVAPLVGQFRVTGSMSYVVTATGPSGTVASGIPVIFVPTTVGVERFTCGAVTTQLTATCTGNTLGNALQGGLVTVRFPLAGDQTADVRGILSGPGPRGTTTASPIPSVSPTETPTATRTPMPSSTPTTTPTMTVTPTRTPTSTSTAIPTPTCAGTGRVYVGNRLSSSVTVFVLDGSGNAISGCSSNVEAPSLSVPIELVVHPAGTRLYATDYQRGVIVFSLDASGNIVPSSGTSVFVPPNAIVNVGLAVNPAGTRLYIANGVTIDGSSSSNVTVFSIDSSGNIISGSGTNVAASTGMNFAWGAEGIAVNPAGTRLYLANEASHNITVFRLDSSGNIIPGSGTNVPEPAGASGPYGVVVNPAGTRLYIGNRGSPTANLTVFTLDSGGNIIPGSGIIVPDPAGARFPQAINVVSVNPAGTRLYASGYITDQVRVFSLDSNGNIIPGSGTIVAEPAGAGSPVGIAVNRAGTRLYVTNESNPLTVFSLDSGGNIVPSSGVNVAGPLGATGSSGIALR